MICTCGHEKEHHFLGQLECTHKDEEQCYCACSRYYEVGAKKQAYWRVACPDASGVFRRSDGSPFTK